MCYFVSGFYVLGKKKRHRKPFGQFFEQFFAETIPVIFWGLVCDPSNECLEGGFRFSKSAEGGGGEPAGYKESAQIHSCGFGLHKWNRADGIWAFWKEL